jgi:Asp-tRNA(Asn)/Glu-tRNA(Gln) amidotransferase A subunit family amidase
MPTEYGTPILAGHRPATDAACVARSREEGAVVLGKTVTQSLACGGLVRMRTYSTPIIPSARHDRPFAP